MCSAQWYRATSTSAGCVSVAQSQTAVGWAGSSNNDQLYQTTNGGQSWSSRAAYTNPYDICHVWGPGTNYIWVVGSGGRCSNTTDNGATWYVRNTGVTFDLYGVSSPTNNPGIAYICGNMERILKSTNYGQSWITQWLQSGVVLNDIYAMSPSVVWACGSLNGGSYVISTTDGGTTWLSRATGSYGACTGLKPLSASFCYAVTDQGYMVTINGSNTEWIHVSDATALYQCWSNSSGQVYACGLNSNGGAVYKYLSGGSWVTQSLIPTTSSNMNDICFGSGSTNGVVVGGGGMYYTTNGGGIPCVEENTSNSGSDVPLFEVRPSLINSGVARIWLHSHECSEIPIAVYDCDGHLVDVIKVKNSELTPWRGCDKNGQKLSAGVYFLRASLSQRIETRKIVVVW